MELSFYAPGSTYPIAFYSGKYWTIEVCPSCYAPYILHIYKIRHIVKYCLEHLNPPCKGCQYDSAANIYTPRSPFSMKDGIPL